MIKCQPGAGKSLRTNIRGGGGGAKRKFLPHANSLMSCNWGIKMSQTATVCFSKNRLSKIYKRRNLKYKTQNLKEIKGRKVILIPCCKLLYWLSKKDNAYKLDASFPIDVSRPKKKKIFTFSIYGLMLCHFP